ncbi:uncharacterized protein LOC133909161 [Phragmites australis]|uniref:uncharacterized protein LOC133909161 n=1 Tax=Phragmites australis TaxID=29695 RepID=UPI002D787311|nr:uncharacterized protein LOC133909161 [Phragmites australis]
MGFDNECILSIQSLPGEYFCPVCRTLIYPNEALQTQCTHLYCKPCLAYVVATTKACPYDGYLVTETDSKPLMESNKSLAETIGKVTVHCLYHKSGCQWQGTLSACITHGTTCAYGNSPVVCNRCGTQIVHRQVQEHAQLCPGLQSQTQQTDGSQAQSSVASTQAVTHDPSLVASEGSAAAASTTLPSASAATASAAATGGPAGATTASTAAVPPSVAASAAATQTPTAEQWYQQQQQLQYSQYYQQQYPGYNPYMQQYQQYGQYQQVYQQYTQPQMQVASQNVVQGSAQPASHVQPQGQLSQPQYMMQSQPENQPQLQPPTGHPQHQQYPVQFQPQNQPYPPHLQAPAGQSQPQQPPSMQSASQVPQLQPQSRIPLQMPGSQAQPITHPPASTQVGNQQLAIPSTQSTPLQVQPHIHAQHPQQQQIVAQQHVQLQTVPPQQNHQPQMQLNSQIQQQSYPQPQAYAQPQNTPYLQQQMPQGAPLQHPVHVSHQQGLAPQHPAPMRPPMPGQQPAMLPPQAVQYTQQQQQHIGYHAQRAPMHSSIPSQTPQQGLPPHSSVSSQAGQSYHQGVPSSQQQVHSQLSQPHGPPYTQQHVPGHGYAGHHVPTSAVRPMSHVAPPQQFQHPPGGSVSDLQSSVMNQQPPMPRTSDNVGLISQSYGGGQPTGQSSLTSETHASKLGKSEIVKNAADNTTVNENKNGGAESAVMRPTTMSQSLGDENMNREQNDFGSVRKDAVQTGTVLDSKDGSIVKDEIAGRTGKSHGPGVQGGQEHKVSEASNSLEKGGSLRQASWQNAGALGSYVNPGTVAQHPAGQDRMLPQHMMHSGPMPYNMQEQSNQMRPTSFSESIRPPRQQPYGPVHSETAPRVFGENQIQMPMPQPVGIKPGDGMIRPPMVAPLPGRHDTMVPPFAPEHLGRPPPLGMSKSNGVGGGPLGSGMTFHEEGFTASGEHLRSFVGGRHNVNHKDIEDDLKQFPGSAHLDGQGLQRGLRPFERGLGRPDGFPDSLPGRPPFPNQQGPFPVGFHEDFSRKPNAAGRTDFMSPGTEFGHHRADGMPNLRNSVPFFQGKSGAPGSLRTDQLGSGNLPGDVQHAFDGPGFPHTRFHPGHMHPDDPNLVADYSRHGFPKESDHFCLGGVFRNGDFGWCRICMFNCGSAENLDLHVQTREHQQCAMDIVLKMKHDVAKRQKLNFGGLKSFHNKKMVAGKGHFRGNRR